MSPLRTLPTFAFGASLALSFLAGCSSDATAPSGSTAGESSSSSSGGTDPLASPWDWVGVVGTGQSLSTGGAPVLTTKQPFNNLKLSLGGATVPPWDPMNAKLTMVPLTEPIRTLETGYPSPYPGNIYGETPHSAMANQITTMVKAAAADHDYVTVHTVVGESGQGIIALNKQMGDTTGMTGRAYAATLFEAGAITRLAKAAKKTYGIGVIVMTHGETDSGSATYKNDLIKLLSDYNTDLAAITGQTKKIPMFLSQQFGYPQTADQEPLANQFQWQLGVDHPGDFVCTGPKYQYPGHGDGIHLSNVGYQLLGEKTAEVYFERIVKGNDWQPLQPTGADRSGRVITVHFHVPVPPLVWDDMLDPPVAWPNGRGFEVHQGATKIDIASVAISGSDIQITCAADLPTTSITVGYAMTSGGTQMSVASKAYRWGQLRDSDPFVGSTTKLANPNYAVSFDLTVK